MGTPAMFRLSPVVDGVHFPSHPFTPTAAPSAANVPLMIGTNLDESAMFVAADPKRRRLSEEDLRRRLTPMLGEHLDACSALTSAPGPRPRPGISSSRSPPSRPRIMSIRLAERKAAGGPAPVFMYLFDWQSDFMGGLFKAAHALEIPFVFDGVDGAPITGERADKPGARRPDERGLAPVRAQRRPEPRGLPDLEPYTAEHRDTLIFDVPPRAERAPRQEELDAWRGVELRRV